MAYTWWKSAVNRSCLSLRATCRTRSSALGAPPRLCVRSAVRSREFPLVRPLPSAASAAGSTALFGGFLGTIGRSDFPCPFILGVCPQTSRGGLQLPPLETDAGPPGSRAQGVHACAGSPTARGSRRPRNSGPRDVAFRPRKRRRHPEPLPIAQQLPYFAAQYPACIFPCQRFTAALAGVAA